MTSAHVVSIHVAAVKKQPMVTLAEVRLVEGVGIEGDRYFHGAGSFSKPGDGPDREVTLIEQEALVACERDHHVVIKAEETRRNLVTQGVALNHLVGRTFQVGTVTLKGIRLCEPCKLLAKNTSVQVMRALVHRGGLRAQIVRGGVVRPGDAVTMPD